MPLISIIVPIYNGEKTIGRCIDSILNQNFDDFELILINDGSVDSTEFICRNYVKNDCRIKFYNKLNGGVSSARNLGISYATGDWITFIDSDDWVTPFYLINMVRHISDVVDLVFSYCTIIKETGERIVEKFPPKTISSQCIELAFVENGLHAHTSPWSKLYRNEIIQKERLAFCEKMSIGEDLVFLYNYISHCRNIVFTNDTDYCYNFDASGSLTKRVNSLESELFGYYKIVQTVKELCNISNMTDIKALHNLDWIMGYYARRVLNALYHNKGIHFRKRLEIIKTIDLSPYLNALYIPAPKEKFLSLLLQHRLIYLYDTIRFIARIFNRV